MKKNKGRNNPKKNSKKAAKEKENVNKNPKIQKNKSVIDKELNKEIALLIKEMNNSSSSDNSGDNEIEESEINVIKKEFINTQDTDDSLSINNNKINKSLNIYANLNGSLNNKTNPFLINFNKGIEEINLQTDETKKFISNENNDQAKTKSKNQNDENEDRYLNKPPYHIQYDNAKKLLTSKIIINELDLKGDKTKKTYNFWYSKFKYLDKKYYQITNSKQENKADHIIYYCTKHNTTINSTKFTANNNKKKIALCNSRVIYIKKDYSYYIDWEHSSYCNKIIKKTYENYADVNKEIENYKNFRTALEEYLDKNPTIKYRDFKLKANKLYYQNDCNFIIKSNTFKNLYYNWRSKSLLFTKYSIFKKDKTKNGKFYLREYINKLLYYKNGKKIFRHEHIIYCSDFFLKKLYKSVHWYIDGTFLFPKDFVQLIVILYLDFESKKRYPGMFILTNNKKYEGYLNIFKSVRNIITLENTKKIIVKSFSTDFEEGLLNAISEIFPEVRGVGCFFHYCKNIPLFLE